VVSVSVKDKELAFDIRPEDPKKKPTKPKSKAKGKGKDARKDNDDGKKAPELVE
jgi:hypothetical protein